DLVHALLLCASQWPADQRANVWLLEQLGMDALRALQVPALSSHLAAVISGNVRHSGVRLPRSSQAAAWLRDAQLWALCSRSDELLMRHVIAALVAPRGPAAGKRMLRTAGGRPTQLAD